MAVRAVILTTLAGTVACGDGGRESQRPSSPDGWWRDRVFYEVFVRSFADSDGDGKGDLAGLTQKLDVLNDGDPATTTDLGVEAIWLMPIMASPSYHGYDVTDYTAVDPEYGTLADFDAFVAAAHQRGIRVILDFVANHTSTAHPWFVESWASPGSPRRDFYSWRASDPGWTRPWDGGGPTWHPMAGAYYYGVFWSGMPDLNYANPAVEAEILDAMKFWVRRGVDGFRLDAVRYLVESDAGQADLPATHALLRRLRAGLEREAPGTLLVGEAWTGAATVATYYGDGDELQLAFGFDLAQGIKDALTSGTAGPLLTALSSTGTALQGKDRGFDAPFLSNHDMPRVMRELGGDAASARLGAALLLAQPGTPFLYYGEELGMQGGAAADDRNKRTPMRWDATAVNQGFSTGTPWFTATEAQGVDVATQRVDPGSLWRLYQRLVALRRDRVELRRGDITFPATVGGGAGLVAFVRTSGAGRALFVANLAPTPAGPFTVNVQGTPAVLMAEGLPSPPSPSAGALAFGELAARGWAYLTIQ